MHPLKLTPAVKNYIWGGHKLARDFNIKSPFEATAEAWMLSAHADGACIVENGEFAGTAFADLITNYPDIVGSNCQNFKYFPMLIKLIDAEDNLSVQVHPSDEYALKHERSLGKTEMWYIIDAAPAAFIYFGFNRDITKEEFLKRLENNTVLEVLNKVEVKAGDTFFIEAGTIHAIGAGILIAEIQQNSNITYRVFDYNRKDSNGNTRELHIKQSLEVINFSKMVTPEENRLSSVLACCKYFTVNKYTVDDLLKINVNKTSFKSLIFIDGSGTITTDDCTVKYKKGDSFFLPAGEYTAEITGFGTVIVSEV